MAFGGLPTGSITAKEMHMVTGIRVYKGLISRVSDWKNRERGVSPSQRKAGLTITVKRPSLFAVNHTCLISKLKSGRVGWLVGFF